MLDCPLCEKEGALLQYNRSERNTICLHCGTVSSPGAGTKEQQRRSRLWNIWRAANLSMRHSDDIPADLLLAWGIPPDTSCPLRQVWVNKYFGCCVVRELLQELRRRREGYSCSMRPKDRRAYALVLPEQHYPGIITGFRLLSTSGHFHIDLAKAHGAHNIYLHLTDKKYARTYSSLAAAMREVPSLVRGGYPPTIVLPSKDSPEDGDKPAPKRRRRRKTTGDGDKLADMLA